MPFLVRRDDCSLQPEMAGAEPAVDRPRKPPQTEHLSESEREALDAWAAKHGFVLRNAVDVQLAEVVWRENQANKQSA